MPDNPSETNKLFSLLDKWRSFPSWQLERRADIFFAVHLEQILWEKLGYKTEKILPEFPVRIGTITNIPINKSFKIDYLIVCENLPKVILLELKTDTTSRREKQDWYLKQAKERNIFQLVDGILKIFDATLSKAKYLRYLHELQELGWLNHQNGIWENVSSDYEIEIVYIQPSNKYPNIEETVITFSEIAELVGQNQNALSRRFAQSLLDWTRNPNELD